MKREKKEKNKYSKLTRNLQLKLIKEHKLNGLELIVNQLFNDTNGEY